MRQLALDGDHAGGPAHEAHCRPVRKHLDDDGAGAERVPQRDALRVALEQLRHGEGRRVQRELRVHRQIAGVGEQLVAGREVVRHAVGELRELVLEEAEVVEAPQRDGAAGAVEHLVEVRRRGERENDGGRAARAGRRAGGARPRPPPHGADAAGKPHVRRGPPDHEELDGDAGVAHERPHLGIVAHHVFKVGEHGVQVETGTDRVVAHGAALHSDTRGELRSS